MSMLTFLLEATSKYGPFRLASESTVVTVDATATFLPLPTTPFGLFKLLLVDKSLLCLLESRCEPCTVTRRKKKNWMFMKSDLNIQLCVKNSFSQLSLFIIGYNFVVVANGKLDTEFIIN